MSEYVEYGGMTDLQYKGMLIDQLNNWQDILKSLPDISENTAVREEIERQIKIIEEKMRFWSHFKQGFTEKHKRLFIS